MYLFGHIYPHSLIQMFLVLLQEDSFIKWHFDLPSSTYLSWKIKIYFALIKAL